MRLRRLHDIVNQVWRQNSEFQIRYNLEMVLYICAEKLICCPCMNHIRNPWKSVSQEPRGKGTHPEIEKKFQTENLVTGLNLNQRAIKQEARGLIVEYFHEERGNLKKKSMIKNLDILSSYIMKKAMFLSEKLQRKRKWLKLQAKNKPAQDESNMNSLGIWHILKHRIYTVEFCTE